VCTTGNGASAPPTPAEGTFEDGGSLNFGVTVTAQAAFGDLDNDGDLDFFAAETSGPDRVFLGQGGG